MNIKATYARLIDSGDIFFVGQFILIGVGATGLLLNRWLG